MRKLLLLLLLIPLLSRAQQCIQSKDPNTGEELKQGMAFLPDTVSNGPPAIITFAKYGGKTYFTVLESFVTRDVDIKSKAKLVLIIKSANDQIKQFTGASDSEVSPLAGFGISVFVGCEISGDDISWFQKNKIISMTVNYEGDGQKGYTAKITPAEAEIITKSVQCIL